MPRLTDATLTYHQAGAIPFPMPDLSAMPMALRVAYLAMHRQTSARLTEHEITADQFVCLAILFQAEDGMIQRELVERATSDQNTISAILALLEKKNYVAREAHTADRRARTVASTLR